ncbi:MAG: hypothetical protein PHF00_02105 [Elusimicrobia bacterium]|nr:hypothetical protein [Elusimicrobiota bacterium]
MKATGLVLGLFCAFAQSVPDAAVLRVPSRQIRALGLRIWQNECRGSYAGLTSWNRGEEFASLGIGHFIWYPEGRSGPFQESFPMLLDFLERHGAVLPEWLTVATGCPWASREEFLKDFGSERMRRLRRFLSRSVDLQARFLAARLESALPRMLASLPESERRRVRFQFERLAARPEGLYVLVDYVNFKGEGLKPQEAYGGHAWGLLQVLQGMNGAAPGREALHEFADSADFVLTRRVRHSPPERREERWLTGWRRRIGTYRRARA